MRNSSYIIFNKNYNSIRSFRVFTIGGLFSSSFIKGSVSLICHYSNDTDKLPMCIPQYTLINKIYRKMLRVVFIYILFIRSFFISEKSFIIYIYLLPVINLLFIYLSNIYPTVFSQFTAFYSHMYVGSQLIMYDYIGSKISTHVLTNSDPILSISSLIHLRLSRKSSSKKRFLRYFSLKVLTGLVIGKGSMTAAGRATIIVGAFTGSAWLYNEHQNRTAMDRRAQANHEAMDRRAQADRDFQAWKYRHEVWKKDHDKWEQSWRKKKPEPKEPIYDPSK